MPSYFDNTIKLFKIKQEAALRNCSSVEHFHKDLNDVLRNVIEQLSDEEILKVTSCHIVYKTDKISRIFTRQGKVDFMSNIETSLEPLVSKQIAKKDFGNILVVKNEARKFAEEIKEIKDGKFYADYDFGVDDGNIQIHVEF